MILIKKCPCCNSKINFWYYYHEDNFKDSKNEDNHIRCKECGNIILLSWRPRTITSIGVLVIFVVSMYLFVEKSLSWSWFGVLLIFIFCASYLSYTRENFICYNETELRQEKESNLGGIIFAIIVLAGALITFWNIFSFASDMKEKNNQKHRTEQTIKDKK